MIKLKANQWFRIGCIIIIASLFLSACKRTTTEPGATASPPASHGAATLTPTSTVPPLPSNTPGLLPVTSTDTTVPTVAPTVVPTEETGGSEVGASIGPENAENLQLILELEQPGSTQLAWLSSSEIALAGGSTLQLYDLENSTVLTATEALTPSLVAASPNGQWLAAAGQGGQIEVWMLPQLTKVLNMTTAADYHTGLAFSTGGQVLAASSGQEVNLWDLSTGDLLQTIQTPYMPVVASFSPDDSQLAVVDPNDFRVHFLDLPGGDEQANLQWTEHASPVLYSAHLTPDWETLAWVTRGTIQLQEVDSGDFGFMLGHEDFIIAFDWAPAGDLLAATTGGTVDGQFVDLAYLWDPATGQEVRRLVLSSGGLDVEFSEDGQQLAVLTNQGKLMVWALAQ